MRDVIIAGVVSTVISSIIVGIWLWYLNDMRDSVSLGWRMSQIENDQKKLIEKIDHLAEEVNNLGERYARLDERLNIFVRYNEQVLNQISSKKKIPQEKVDSAKQYLNTLPAMDDAINYLETNLGLSRTEAKAVVSPNQGDSYQMIKQKEMK